MANPKFSETLTNTYTGEEKEITASKEDVFLRRKNEQITKWENEQYIRERQQEAQRITDKYHAVTSYLQTLSYYNLTPLSPELYLKENISKIHRRSRPMPTLEDAKKTVGITGVLELKAVFFEESKKKLEELDIKAKELFSSRLKEYIQNVKKDEEDYLQRRKKEEKASKTLIQALSRGGITAAKIYYSYALDHDYFSLNTMNRYIPEYSSISYIRNTREIRLSYRIPNSSEIPEIAKYEYNKKTDSIEPMLMDAKSAARWKLRIAESVLLRAAALVFMSDAYERVKSVSITGYLRYYDSAFGNYQIKNVIWFSMSREIYDKISLELVNPVDLFNRVLKAKTASGLYKKEPYAITEIE